MNNIKITPPPLVLSLIFLLISALSYANGNSEKGFKELELSTEIGAFSSLELLGSASYILQRGDVNKIDITMQDTPASLLYRYEDDSLSIKNKNKLFENSTDIKVLITYAQDISDIDIQGAIHLEDKKFTSNTLDLDTSGSGIIIIDALTVCDFNFDSSGSGLLEINNIAVNTFNVDMSGSGSLNVAANQINTFHLETSGSSNILMPNTMIHDASIETSGASTVNLWVADSLSIESSGSSDISYFGTPLLDVQSSGSGDIEALSERDTIKSEELNIPMPNCQ